MPKYIGVIILLTTYSCALRSDLKKHVIIHYDFENVTNTTVLDTSGHEINAEMKNGSFKMRKNETCGQAIEFTNGIGSLSFNASNYNQSSSDVTIATWIWMPKLETRQVIFLSSSNATKKATFRQNRFFYFGIRKKGGLRWFLAVTDPPKKGKASKNVSKKKVFHFKNKSRIIQTNRWYHVAAVYNSSAEKYSVGKVFVNGTELQRNTTTEDFVKRDLASRVPLLGFHPEIRPYRKKGLVGLIDDFYIFNKALNGAEVEEVMKSCRTGQKVTSVTEITPAAPQVTMTTETTITAQKDLQISPADIAKAKNITSTSKAKEYLKELFSGKLSMNTSVDQDKEGDTKAMEITKDLEKIGLILARNILKNNQTVAVVTKSAFLAMRIPTSGFTFPSESDQASQKINETMEFPDEIVETEGKVPRAVVCMFYTNLQQNMPQVTTVSSSFVEANATLTLNSKIVGAAVDPPLTKQLKHPIEISFIHPPIDKGRQICSFWNHSARTTDGKLGQWSTYGCESDEKSTATKTVCRCYHLTNFALLLQREGVPYSDPPLSLRIITIIGCSLSILAFLLCLVMFFTLKKKDIRHYLHINLSLAIAVSQVLLLLGVSQTKYEALCKTMAICLHYFYLVAFFLMLSEGIHLALLIETAFKYGDLKLPVYLITSWGLPLLIVGITLAARYDNYGGKKACFITAEEGTVYAFVGPFGLTLLINFVVLVVVLKQVIRKTSLPISSESASKFAIARATVRSLVILFPVMGFTWVFGILFFAFRSLVFEYLFGIFCSLQGFLIFLFQYVLNTESRNAFLRATQRWRSSTTTGSRLSRNESRGVPTQASLASPEEKIDGTKTEKQDTCNLLVYHKSPEENGSEMMNSRTVSTLL